MALWRKRRLPIVQQQQLADLLQRRKQGEPIGT